MRKEKSIPGGIGWRIRQYRMEKGMTQKELAAMAGIDRTSLSAYERGKRMPDIFMLCSLADIFDITLDELAGRKNSG